MKDLKDLSKKEIIKILLKYYQYPARSDHSIEFLKTALIKRRIAHPYIKK